MSLIYDIAERLHGWERIRGNRIPPIARINYNCEPEDDINYRYGDGTFVLQDRDYDYKVVKKVFAPDQGTRIPRIFTYRRLR
jgi:hypothetical protein